MSTIQRPASAYVHGDGAVVVVPGRVAAWLERTCDLRRLRVEQRGRGDAELDAVLVAIATAAAAWRSRVESELGTKPAPNSEPVSTSTAVITTADAATRCGFTTPRAIVRAIADDRLKAHKLGGRWLIDIEDFADYCAARAA